MEKDFRGGGTGVSLPTGRRCSGSIGDDNVVMLADGPALLVLISTRFLAFETRLAWFAFNILISVRRSASVTFGSIAAISSSRLIRAFLSFEGLPSSRVFCLKTGRIGLDESPLVFLATDNDSDSLRRTDDCGGGMTVCFGDGIGLTSAFAGDCNTP